MADDSVRTVPLLRIDKGRGAVSNVAGRFERDAREPFDDGWPVDTDPAPAGATTVGIERPRSLLSRNQSPDVPFELSVNPYRGCEHGCIYCYARPNHAYVGLSPGRDFETKLFAKPDAAALLRDEIARPGYTCQPINFSGVTDAWQPIEREWRITRQLLQLLHDCHHPVTVITKSALIERDIDLLAPMAQRGLCHALVTLTTLDADFARRWEPRAAAPWRRLQTIRRLSEAGIPVTVSVAPVAPFLNEPEVERVLAAAREAGATRAQTMLLRLPNELRTLFADWLQAHYPDRAQRVLERLAEQRGGRLNDPRFGSRMKGEGTWAELMGQRVNIALRKLGYQRDRLSLRTDLFVPPRSDGQMGLFQP